jgi:catechol 2,3-dioxygenase-like lactoylglutathione lyase family enzyme
VGRQRRITCLERLAHDGLAFQQVEAHARPLGALPREHEDRWEDRLIADRGRLFITLKPRAERVSADEVVRQLRPKVSQMVGTKAFMQNIPTIRIGQLTKSPYQYVLRGASAEELCHWVPIIEKRMRAIPALLDFWADLQISQPQVRIDIDRAKAWYADKLGFSPASEMGGFVLDYRAGDSRFEVYKTEFAGTAKNTIGVWRLVGLRDEVARLRANGVVFEEYDFGDDEKTVDGILTDASGEDLTAWFKDSEGNILAISEDRN